MEKVSVEVQTGESLEGCFPAWRNGVSEWIGVGGGVRGRGDGGSGRIVWM